MDGRFRRDVLRGVGGLAAGALAGCAGSVPGAEATSKFVRWAPSPARVVSSATPYAVLGVKPSVLVAADTPWTNQLVASLTRNGPLGDALAVADVEHVQALGTALAFDGGFDGGAVREVLRGRQFESADPIGGYEVRRAPAGAYLASSDDRLVVGRERGQVASLVRTHEGDVERLPAGSEPAGALLERLPTTTVTGARVHEPGVVGFPGARAEGIAIAIDGSRTEATGVVVFEPGAADPDGVAEWAARADPIDRPGLETRTAGNAVVVAATFPTSDLEGAWTGFPAPADARGTVRAAPRVSFAFDYESVEPGRGRLTVTHHSGDAVPAGELYLRGDGYADVAGVDQTTAGRWQGTTDADGRVTAGASVTVGATGAYEVRVVWEAREGDASAALAVDSGPDA